MNTRFFPVINDFKIKAFKKDPIELIHSECILPSHSNFLFCCCRSINNLTTKTTIKKKIRHKVDFTLKQAKTIVAIFIRFSQRILLLSNPTQYSLLYYFLQ